MSSLRFQIIVYFDRLYTGAYLVLMLLLYVFKASALLYAPNTISMEIAGLLLLVITQAYRQFIGTVGNRTETAGPLGAFLLLLLPSILGLVYFLAFQTYV